MARSSIPLGMRQSGGTGAEHMVAAAIAAFPDLAGARVRVVNSGWDCVALDVADRMIFKFPRNALAETALRREAGLLVALRPRLPLAVPLMALHPGPPLFSSHRKLPGTRLEARDYARLDASARDRLARDMAALFAALHALDVEEMRALGALAIRQDAPTRSVLTVLPVPLRDAADALLAKGLPPDPLGQVFGYFDGHGGNMAFDHARGVLNGVYDFADSGLGPLHREFVQPGLIGADLVARIADIYGEMTGRRLDHARIRHLGGLHRLMEVEETAGDADLCRRMIAGFADWVNGK